jgi:hypothetical protein
MSGEACCESCASHDAMNGHALASLKSIEAMLARLTPPSHGYASSFFVDEAGVNLIVPVTGGRIWVMSYVLVCATPVNVTWGGGNDQAFRNFQGNEGPSAGLLSFGANTGASSNAGAWPNYLFATDPGEGLCLNLSANVVVGGHLSYYVGDPFLLSA